MYGILKRWFSPIIIIYSTNRKWKEIICSSNLRWLKNGRRWQNESHPMSLAIPHANHQLAGKVFSIESACNQPFSDNCCFNESRQVINNSSKRSQQRKQNHNSNFHENSVPKAFETFAKWYSIPLFYIPRIQNWFIWWVNSN